MDAEHYLEEVKRTLITEDKLPKLVHKEMLFVWLGMGLSGEAGELANKIKKQILHRHGYDPEVLLDEAGDVLWYLTALLDVMGYTLEDAMYVNVAKLKERLPTGWDEEMSKH